MQGLVRFVALWSMTFMVLCVLRVFVPAMRIQGTLPRLCIEFIPARCIHHSDRRAAADQYRSEMHALQAGGLRASAFAGLRATPLRLS